MSEESTKNDSTKWENERQYKLIDQLLSMHASLRDKYGRRAFWLNTAQIGISLILCVFAFVGPNRRGPHHGAPAEQKSTYDNSYYHLLPGKTTGVNAKSASRSRVLLPTTA